MPSAPHVSVAPIPSSAPLRTLAGMSGEASGPPRDAADEVLQQAMQELTVLPGSASRSSAHLSDSGSSTAPLHLRIDGQKVALAFALFVETRVPTIVAHSEHLADVFDVQDRDWVLKGRYSLLCGGRLTRPEALLNRVESNKAHRDALLHGVQQYAHVYNLHGFDGTPYTLVCCQYTIVLSGRVYTMGFGVRCPTTSPQLLAGAVVYLATAFSASSEARGFVKQLLGHTFNVEAPRRSGLLRPLGFRRPGSGKCVLSTRNTFLTMALECDDDLDTQSSPGDLEEYRVLDLDTIIQAEKTGDISVVLSQLNVNSEDPRFRSRGSLLPPKKNIVIKSNKQRGKLIN